MRALNQKIVRDSWQLRWQFLAIALVLGCGVAMLIMSWSMLASLQLTQERYYERFRFAHIFAQLKRAPNSLVTRIAEIPGVSQVEARVVAEVVIDVSGVPEPAVGRLVSLPVNPGEGLNTIYLRVGRIPENRSQTEVVVSEAFANEHRLVPGDHVMAVLNGHRQRLEIVGIAVSPEYVYQVRGGDVLPNDRSFGVFWMGREPLAKAFDLEGAFNDLSLYLTPRASEAAAIAQLDLLLTDYGGRGAYGRDMQASNRYITNELRELRNMGYYAPVIFLVVAAMLFYIVLSRIIGTQRVQIAVLKAFGYSRWEIGLHYLKLAIPVVAVGIATGTIAGRWLGSGMTQMYSHFFHFPVLEFRLQPGVIVWGVVISAVAVAAGVTVAVRRAIAAPAAEAMRPESPAVYRPALLERLGIFRFLTPETRMILRHVERRPGNTILSVVGISLAISVMVLGDHAADAVNELIEFQFWTVERYNIAAGFTEPVDARAVYELRQLPGVAHVEPIRGVSTQMRFRNHSRRQELLALRARPELLRLIDRDGKEHSVPADGMLISSKLAELLSVRPGNQVELEIQEGFRPVVRLTVNGVIEDMIGTSAYVQLSTLHRMLRESETISGVFLFVAPEHLPEVYQRLKQTPRVASVTSKLSALQSLRETLARTLLQMRTINLVFAWIIACGVVYNSARIIVAERSRDLASLRVLGYTRWEISYILLGELALLSVAAIPLGNVLGYFLVVLASLGYDTELFRLPVVVYASTYALATTVVLLAIVASGSLVRRRLDKLDLLSVLKANE